MRGVIVGVVGAAALVAGLVALRAQRSERRVVLLSPPGEGAPGKILLDRLRERGF